MIGIDIGSSQIKAVDVDIKGKDVVIQKAMVIPVKASILSESDLDQSELIKSLKHGMKDAGMRSGDAAVSLLESQVFTRIIETPALSEKELSQALKWEAERYIPLPLNEVSMSSAITAKKENTMEVLLVASPTRLIDKYMAIFRAAGISIDAIENEAISIVRVYGEPSVNLVVVDIGGDATNLYVVHGDRLALVRSIAMGGNSLTKSLSVEHNLAATQAEEYKRTYGLDPNQMEGQIARSLSALIDPLVTEITGSMAFFKERYPEEVISRIVLTGGGALLPNLPAYINSKTQVETSIGNPWQRMSVSSNVSNSMKGFECIFATATGLAIREVGS